MIEIYKQEERLDAFFCDALRCKRENVLWGNDLQERFMCVCSWMNANEMETVQLFLSTIFSQTDICIIFSAASSTI